MRAEERATDRLLLPSWGMVLSSHGVKHHGSESSSVQDQLNNVQQIQGSCTAFPAILGDGSVVTWGNAANGGDSNSVQDQLNAADLEDARSTSTTALRSTTTLRPITSSSRSWCSAATRCTRNVQEIQAFASAFAAILADGSVVTWGSAYHGGDSSSVQDQLKDVQQIQASGLAFAAILGDGYGAVPPIVGTAAQCKTS